MGRKYLFVSIHRMKYEKFHVQSMQSVGWITLQQQLKFKLKYFVRNLTPYLFTDS